METRYANCSIVISAYNEEESIGSLLEEIINLALVEEIIVVNDCSTDSTQEIVRRFSQVNLVNNYRNMGNGASVRKGILKSTKEYIVLMDADLQNDPADIPMMLNKIDEGLDVVS